MSHISDEVWIGLESDAGEIGLILTKVRFLSVVEQRRTPQSVPPSRPPAERLPDEQRERAAAYAQAYAESKG